MSIGKNIQLKRILNHMDQKDLANLLHVSNRTISSWECGRTEPNIGMIEKMSKIFGCSKTDLIEAVVVDEPTFYPGSSKKHNPNERIKELMEYYGLTQAELCRETGITKTALSNYLNNSRTPRMDQLAKIVEIFNINPAWLMGYAAPMERPLVKPVKSNIASSTPPDVYNAGLHESPEGMLVEFDYILLNKYHHCSDGIRQAVNKLLEIEDDAKQWGYD